MGGKVIKFNLVGAIFVVVFIIAAIVGTVVFVTNRNNGENGNKDKTSNNQNIVKDDEDSYKELNRKESVMINGIVKEITMKTYERKNEYKIDYDIDSFYVNEIDENSVFLESLVSDTILIKILKKENFDSVRTELIINESDKKREDSTYRLDTRDCSGHLCYIETKETNSEFLKTYYIQNDRDYYVIDLKCGKEYKISTIPIVEKIVESFKIM